MSSGTPYKLQTKQKQLPLFLSVYGFLYSFLSFLICGEIQKTSNSMSIIVCERLCQVCLAHSREQERLDNTFEHLLLYTDFHNPFYYIE